PLRVGSDWRRFRRRPRTRRDPTARRVTDGRPGLVDRPLQAEWRSASRAAGSKGEFRPGETNTWHCRSPAPGDAGSHAHNCRLAPRCSAPTHAMHRGDHARAKPRRGPTRHAWLKDLPWPTLRRDRRSTRKVTARPAAAPVLARLAPLWPETS